MNTATSSSAGSTQKKVLAAPPQTPGHQRPRSTRRRGKAEAEADPVIRRLAEQRLRHRGQIDPAGKVVRGHQVERLAADQPMVVQGSAVEQRQPELHIVGGGRYQPAAARDERWRGQEAARRRIVLQRHAAARLGLVTGGEAVRLVRRNMEAGIDHAEGPENTALEEIL
jgi:hypothetical protein